MKLNQSLKLTATLALFSLSTAGVLNASSARLNGDFVIQEPLGPQPSGLATRIAQGYLTVYTPTDTVDDGQINYYPHTGYTVYTVSGNKIKAVLNRDSVHDEQPQQVALPAGTYKIKTDFQTVATVVIENGKTTVVNLDDDTILNIPKDAGNHLVKTPDGKIIGWKAAAAIN
ncbi:MAG: hypothetical protein LBH01_11985 [Verrucomicrobiales bacterium]|jgi:hypothetical protein|nr:hypothetical protein [Verrucomicrobiales bacterium]